MSVASFTNFQPWPFLAGMLVVIGLHFLAAVLVKILHKIFRAPVQRNADDLATPIQSDASAEGGDTQDDLATPTQSDASTGTRGAASNIVEKPPSDYHRDHLSAESDGEENDQGTPTQNWESTESGGDRNDLVPNEGNDAIVDFQVLRILLEEDKGKKFFYFAVKPIVEREKLYAENCFKSKEEMDIIKQHLKMTNCKMFSSYNKERGLNPTFRVEKESPDEDVVISYTERDGEVLKSWTFSAGFRTSSLVLSNNFAVAWNPIGSVTPTSLQKMVFTLLPFKTKPEFGTEEFVLLFPKSHLEFSFFSGKKFNVSHTVRLDTEYRVEFLSSNCVCPGSKEKVVVKWKQLEIDSIDITE